jgi:hypothetical protein
MYSQFEPSLEQYLTLETLATDLPLVANSCIDLLLDNGLPFRFSYILNSEIETWDALTTDEIQQAIEERSCITKKKVLSYKHDENKTLFLKSVGGKQSIITPLILV